MRITTATAFTVLGAVWGLAAQQKTDSMGARELYYSAMVRADPPPPARHVAQTTTAPSNNRPVTVTPVSTAALHLGLRYNLVLVNAETGKSSAAAPDRIFRTGECFALDIETNRAGYLYVLAKQSSGSWHPLLPSTDADMATESNVIQPGKKVRIPLEHCFEIQDPPGVETLFVVLSREPRDSFEMNENLKAAPEAPRRATPRPTATVQVAEASVSDGAVARMREQFGTRDIAIKKISQPIAAAEPAEAVYVVNSSANPASNLAAQIEVHHR